MSFCVSCRQSCSADWHSWSLHPELAPDQRTAARQLLRGVRRRSMKLPGRSGRSDHTGGLRPNNLPLVASLLVDVRMKHRTAMDNLSFASYFELCVAVPNNSGPAIESYSDLAG